MNTMNIIIGVYNGYNSVKTSKGGIYYFLKSLRHYNKTCKIFIICEEKRRFKELNDICAEYNCILYSDFFMAYEMMFYRFIIYDKIIRESSETIDKILLCDLNDVIFQADPFEIQFTEEIYCATEQNLYGDESNTSSAFNIKLMLDCFLKNPIELDFIKDKYVICAGTILGTAVGIQKFLSFYVNSQPKKPPRVNDQALLNIYIYFFSDSKHMLEYTHSRILTLDQIQFNSLNIMDNTIYNEENEPYAIVHQIDRCNLPFMKYLVDSL